MLGFGFIFSVLWALISANCGSYYCSSVTVPNLSNSLQQQSAPSYTYRYQMPAIPTQSYQYFYPANSYQIPPQKFTNYLKVQKSVDNEALGDKKAATYDDFEKELDKLKPGTIAIKDNSLDLDKLNTTRKEVAVTYNREVPGMPSEPYISRVSPYRPVHYVPLPIGCQQYAVPQQFLYSRELIKPEPTYVTAPPIISQKSYASLLQPPINDCCGKCGAPCKVRSKHNVIALASRIFSAQFVPRRDSELEDEPKDPKCNSEKLKDTMNKFITRTVALSKRLIQKNAENEFGGYFSVFCSTDDFSYVVRSEMFCQVQKDDIICYAFKHN